ncbi:tryptophan-rich sensory protein TspO [Sedimentimonas flavescens]|uniref:tryptophan-rich sensory protein TspO n=1 Tax=Sedimentimonas flavescens TaxID=2851012 RepID=UPI0021A3A9B9|nr:TspO/MBR family protein [Sedimentimonas flavescens]MCT2541013.1 tryptophan-rich sensory protein [Sedimentimonas flavescens]
MTLSGYFAVFLAASCAAAATGMVFKPGDWYAALRKPSFTPPGWVFPVVWSYLYVSLAYAAARVAEAEGSQFALALFALQIALNTLWTPVFFGARRMAFGMVVIALLWGAVAAMGLAFLRLDLIAGLLVAPYLIWLSLAAALNWRIWRDNRAL